MAKWKNPVNSQMGSKVPSLRSSTGRDAMEAPFGKPHDVGNGGIPLKIYENISPSQGTRLTDTNTAGLSAPSAQGPTRSVQRVAPPKNGKR